MKTFFVLVFIILSLGAGASQYSVEEFEPTVFSGVAVNPVSVVEKQVYYPNASEDEESVVTVFVSTFKGWPSKVKVELDDEVGIFY